MADFKYFLYLFFMHSAFALSIFYLNENFQEAFSSLSAANVTRGIVVGAIMLFYSVLIQDLNSNFKELKKTRKFVLFFGSFITAMVTMLFLISI